MSGATPTGVTSLETLRRAFRDVSGNRGNSEAGFDVTLHLSVAQFPKNDEHLTAGFISRHTIL